MVLVSYSESEGSEDDKAQAQAKKASHAPTTKPDPKFTVDKSNPRKIKVHLHEIKADSTPDGGPDGEPAAKRPKVGGGVTSFNSMLPAPMRDTQSTNGTKTASSGAPRKVFSLKTGAEPGFSRESDAELKEPFTGQDPVPAEARLGGRKLDEDEKIGTDGTFVLPPTSEPGPPKQGNPIMFKPLSVGRNTQKQKKPPAKNSAPAATVQTQVSDAASAPETSTPASKVNLFSIGSRDEPSDAAASQQAQYTPLVYQSKARDEHHNPVANDETEDASAIHNPAATNVAAEHESQTQSLDSIAADLNLSASAKRQLLGRNHQNASKISSSIINFNTDQEYAANEALRASGEQVQHNPVRAIAPGKHSLKQLVSAASGQKEALEESFASGRRNKKEAGGRYGW